MKDKPVIGIDLGTSYCCVAVFRNIDGIEIVPNEFGERITPSYVAFTDEDKPLVGTAAKKMGLRHPEQCIYEVKRLLGRSFRDPAVQQDAQRWPFKVSSGPCGEAVLEVPEARGRKSSFRPEQISALLLKKMKQIAEDYTNCRPITDAVITVPAYFDQCQRKATMAAGVSAGLNVLRLMSEPTAAALAYGHMELTGRGPVGKKLLVFDLGGGTFDVSIVTIEEGPDEHCERFKKDHLDGEDLLANPRVLPRLKQVAVGAKHILSFIRETEIDLDYRDRVLGVKLGRAEFEALNKDLFDRCMTIVEQALCDAKMSKDEISDVVLAGGSTRIPKVQEMLTAFFNRLLIKAVNADEAVAFGSAVQAGLLARRDKCTEISVRDVTSVSIGVEGHFGIRRVLIPRNSLLPATASGKFSTSPLPTALVVTIRLFEGERVLCAHNRSLGELRLGGFTPGAQYGEVLVVVNIDAHGILHVIGEALKGHKETGKKVEATGALETNVVQWSGGGTEATDWCSPTAKAEDARIWAAKDSMDRLWTLMQKLREQQSSNKFPVELEKHLGETFAWSHGQQERASKEDYDKLYEELDRIARSYGYFMNVT
ncbi:hypothetical protein CBR_g21185 [Chara braunii]|uniref:Uncharacterized protein n=1 Tax=Chara braunii TaxID=69332 RepID=A0A388L153_CHABU|nr:hypothetical protein CBR_g21185 [Chara braunii]|eukprot:GBG75943.1 hypothetical protein CBR_g21185 [Chara braunii]